ncbi:MAG: cbb3-type cytochrome oxidase assembly protein CcoS [Pseudomonadota bacterium]|nr:cbb3-type cytochrome oxidase assembly protein CcoS [Pseudomonadota bacterium]
MEIIFVLIPLALGLMLIAIGVFFWAVRSGQFEDLETPAWQVLLDDDARPGGPVPPDDAPTDADTARRPGGDADR